MTDEPVAAPKRRGVKKADRNRIGERDGWLCCICGRLVDGEHVWQKPEPLNPDLVEQAAAILADGADERITDWAGTDIARARAARSVWPKNPYSEQYAKVFLELQAMHTELFELAYPYTRDEARKLELKALIAQAEKTCSALSDKSAEEYSRRRPQFEALEALCGVYRGRNKDHPSIEHRVPVIAGGTSDEENLAIAHLGCNLKRGENALLIADLMRANQMGIPVEGRAAFLEEQQRQREEIERFLLEQERRRRAYEEAEARHAADLSEARAEDDELRREIRRLGDRLRRTQNEKERRKIDRQRERLKVKRVKTRSRVRSLEDQCWLEVARAAPLLPHPEVAREEVARVVGGGGHIAE